MSDMNAKTATIVDRYRIEEALDAVNMDATEHHVSSILSCGNTGVRPCVSIVFPGGVPELGMFMFNLGQDTEGIEISAWQALNVMSRALRVDTACPGLVAYFPGFAFGDT